MSLDLMLKKPSTTPSTSFVVSKLPADVTEERVREFFKDIGPIESVNFHYADANLFLRSATVVFKDMETARKVSAKFLGNDQGSLKLSVFFSIRPFDKAPGRKPGEVATMKQFDDIEAVKNPYYPGYFVEDWAKHESIPEIPKNTTLASFRFGRISSLCVSSASLTSLYLKGNNITSISQTISLPILQTLDLSFNLLTELPQLSMIAPNLQELDVQNNRLTAINHDIIQLKKLDTLDISSNSIELLPSLPKTVKVLFCNKNCLSRCEFSHHLALKSCSFSENFLTEIPGFVTGRVDHSILAFNRIKSFEACCLSNLVEVLDLSHNCLYSIPASIFSIQTLKVLTLFHNNIEKIPSELSTSRLQELNVSENPIDSLPLLPSTLQFLKISFCRFCDISKSIPDPNSILKLHATGNRLTSLPNLPEVEELIVGSNCLSSLPQISDSYLTKTLIVDASHNELTAVPQMYGCFSLLDLSFNQIKEVSDVIFSHRSTVKLTGNPLSMDINLSNYEFIEYLDIVRTEATISGELQKGVKELATDFDDEVGADLVRMRFECDDRVGYSEMVGLREKMEDAMIVRQRFSKNTQIYAVFDGHGGRKASRAAAAAFPDLLPKNAQISASDIIKIIDDLQELFISSNEKSGTTMEFAVISSKSLFVVHLGDSKCALIRKDGTVRFCTEEHNPCLRSEMERLRDEKIMLRNMRTGGILSMSAAIGDVQVKGVRHRPDFFNIELDDEDGWLIIGCDGMWDAISPEDASLFVQRSRSAHEAAEFLRDEAFTRGSEDNISVVVVDLR